MPTGYLYKFMAIGAVIGASATVLFEWSRVVFVASILWAILEWILARVAD